MKYIVEITKKHEGFKVGQKKDLPLDTAQHLEKKGIAKILGEVPSAKKVAEEAEETGKQVSKQIEELDKKQNERISILEESVVELKILIEELSKKVDKPKK